MMEPCSHRKENVIDFLLPKCMKMKIEIVNAKITTNTITGMLKLIVATTPKRNDNNSRKTGDWLNNWLRHRLEECPR